MHELDNNTAGYYHIVCLTCFHYTHLSIRPVDFLPKQYPKFLMFCQVCDKIQTFRFYYSCSCHGGLLRKNTPGERLPNFSSLSHA